MYVDGCPFQFAVFIVQEIKRKQKSSPQLCTDSALCIVCKKAAPEMK